MGAGKVMLLYTFPVSLIGDFATKKNASCFCS